ncbi:MAG: thioredoxin family protein [Spirochaetia bacterium]
MENVSDQNFSELVLNSQGSVLVFFSADWCSHCKVLEPTLKAIEGERSQTLKILYCNVDETREHAGNYQLQGVPTVILFKDGQPVSGLVGAQPKDALDSFLDQHQ